jgi:hypothetical protein
MDEAPLNTTIEPVEFPVLRTVPMSFNQNSVFIPKTPTFDHKFALPCTLTGNELPASARLANFPNEIKDLGVILNGNL